jgi:hypothetical protein
LNGTVASYKIGMRTVEERTGGHKWEEGSVKYYAETVSYKIVPNAQFASAFEPVEHIQFRLVLRFDNADDKWVLATGADGTTFDPQDVQRVEPQFVAADLGPLRAAIDKARLAEFAAIEAQVLAAGQIARTSDIHVLANRRAGLAYYRTFAPFAPSLTVMHVHN